MLHVFAPVVIGEGPAQMFRVLAERTVEGNAHILRRLRLELSEFRVPGLALDGDKERRFALARDHGVRFPMPRLRPCLYDLRTLRNGFSVRNMKAFVAFPLALSLPSHMGMSEAGNERSFLGVDPLVNGFVADRGFWMLLVPSACGEFR